MAPRTRRVVDPDSVPTRDEVEAAAADHAAQERADAKAPPVARVARGFVHATSPENGQPVVLVPGELLPAWAPDEDPS